MTPFPIEILATSFFALAVLHTFMVQRFASLSHRIQREASKVP